VGLPYQLKACVENDREGELQLKSFNGNTDRPSILNLTRKGFEEKGKRRKEASIVKCSKRP